MLLVLLTSGCVCCPTSIPGFGGSATPPPAATSVATLVPAPTSAAPVVDGVLRDLSDSDPDSYQIGVSFWDTPTGVAFEPQTDTAYVSSFTISYTPVGEPETTKAFPITKDELLPTMHVYSPDESKVITVVANYKDGGKRVVQRVTYTSDGWVEA